MTIYCGFQAKGNLGQFIFFLTGFSFVEKVAETFDVVIENKLS